ncbi:hypothetical protein PQR34_45830 [Paraburkholderia sediminicola]|uniref:hypothetical protein n=1 Tax=Paraburkholderia sediminicola TaxID=458836 RepID=UPI0038BDA4DD
MYVNSVSGVEEVPASGLAGAYELISHGRSYLGSAPDLRVCFQQHLNSLLSGTHRSIKFQRFFNINNQLEFRYVPTSDINDARAMTRHDMATFPGKDALCNEKIPQLQSRTSRAKARLTFQSDGYKVKAGASRKQMWLEPVYREKVMARRASPEAQAKRAAHFRRVSINGIVYPGLTAAARQTGINRTTIYRRCINPKFRTFFYLPPISEMDGKPRALTGIVGKTEKLPTADGVSTPVHKWGPAFSQSPWEYYLSPAGPPDSIRSQ